MATLIETLKEEVEKVAKETNRPELDVITTMQGLCAVEQNEEMLDLLCELKHEYFSL